MNRVFFIFEFNSRNNGNQNGMHHDQTKRLALEKFRCWLEGHHTYGIARVLSRTRSTGKPLLELT